ncbi:MAG TPA: oligosaccharide flippase family protein [Polyangiaceae bacterium]|nr:oligosaccharide flippase family protein [Polyangiaceae bacterium]
MSLAKKAAAGFLWATAANLGSRVITIGSTFVLTRFLTPEVQGEVNVATVFVATLGWATSFGVGQYLAAHPRAGRQVAFHGSVLVLLSGLCMIAACVALRDAAGAYLHTPDMARYVPGLAVSQFIDRFGAVPRSVLVRDMRFREVGARVAFGELAFAFSSVGFAALGWGGDAIVGANLVRAVLGLGFLALIVDRREYLEPSPFDPARLREILRFGLPISISYVFHVGSMTWDNLFVAARFGESANGLYNQAYRLADLPASNVGEQVNDVLVPTFARVEDPEARARGLARAAGLMSLVVFPMAAGLGVIAPTLVGAFYPPTYAGVSPFLAVLAPLSMARSIGVLLAGYLQVLGKTRSFVVLDIILVATLLGSMYLLAPLGSTATAFGVGIAFSINVASLLWVLRPEGVRPAVIVAAVARPLLACGPMVAAVLGLRHALEPLGLPPFVRLGAEAAVGALAYVAGAFVLAPALARDFLELGLGVLRRRRARKKPDDDAPADASPAPDSGAPASGAPASGPASDDPTSASAASASVAPDASVAHASGAEPAAASAAGTRRAERDRSAALDPAAEGAASTTGGEPASADQPPAESITESAFERALNLAVEHTSELASERGAGPAAAPAGAPVVAPGIAPAAAPALASPPKPGAEAVEPAPESIMLPTTRSASLHVEAARPVPAPSESPAESPIESSEREPAAGREGPEAGRSERARPEAGSSARPMRSHGPSRPLRPGGPGRSAGGPAAGARAPLRRRP